MSDKITRYFRLKHLFNKSSGPLTFSNDHDLAQFLRGLRNADGSWKTTRPQRHATANKFLIEQLIAEKANLDCLYDVGVSSGITTSELIHDLGVAGFTTNEVIAVDRFFDVNLVRISIGFYAVTDENGYVLRLEAGAFDFSPWCSKRDLITGIAIIKKIFTSLAKIKLSKHSPSGSTCSPLKLPTRRLRLLSPSLSARRGVRILEHDLLDPFDNSLHGRSDILRIANVLNTDRLNDYDIRKIATNLAALCKEGSFIYACRSTVKSTKASLFRFKNGCYNFVSNLNGGVDAESLLLNLKITK